jgi:D-amino-acid dehydrogenase
MKVIVIGAGLIGVSTAYFLNRGGHDVLVLDRADGPGRETSFANGGLLTPSMADPWNAPGCWRTLLASLGRTDAAMQLRVKALPSLAAWGIRFLLNSRLARFERNTLSNFRLALHSLAVMEALRRDVHCEYGRGTAGSLKLFRDAASLERATYASSQLAREGLSFRKVSPAEIVEIEPALVPVESQFVGALQYPADESGDAHRFCLRLAEQARQQGVEFRFATDVASLEMRSGSVAAAVSGAERFVADRYVVAAGSYGTSLLRQLGLHLPVRPAKGYSITFDDREMTPKLCIPLVDDRWHAALVPFEGALRVVGTAEFAGYDLSIDAARIDNLKKLLRGLLPHVQLDPAAARAWCGLRPMSVDGVPIIGATTVPNLFVNTGHGHLGWTMAAGSGQLFADLLSGTPPAIDPAPYAWARFE